ncbi:head maturation protease, ClpP-related [Paenibacillus lemnae]|uniref:Clp protease ClpP n=1 Tax=Paenibacillus lemnae TaxID=1330551 RepID=A0A848MB25_PAELE|nr:head maturation protease, ClpP-related [Paenibacillus lemnae]NMO97459.1 Clp protease ClpP [Paenibacillus lemnae]
MRHFTRQDYFKSFKNQSHAGQLKKIKRNFKAERIGNGTTLMTIYGFIGNSQWEDSISAADVDNALRGVTGDININLNSPGGIPFEGISIYQRLKEHKGKVTIYVDGWACAAASVITMAADKTIMGLGAMMMIREESSLVVGTKSDMRKVASVLDELDERIIEIYMTKAKVSRDKVRSMMGAEAWLNVQEAVNIGFANSTAGSNGKQNKALSIL